jgi:hypothetical protein
MPEKLNLMTRDGTLIPVMNREEALARGLIFNKARRKAQPLYDLALTQPYSLTSESDMLINACTNLSRGNRHYLVVHDHKHAAIYISTSARAQPRLSPEDRKTIEEFFQNFDDAKSLEEAQRY